VHLAALASILQQEWVLIRDGVNVQRGTLAQMLQRRWRILTEVLHNHNTTMIALTHSAPMQALGRSVQELQERVQGEGVGQKRGLENAGDLSEGGVFHPRQEFQGGRLLEADRRQPRQSAGMHPCRLRLQLRVLS